VRYSLYDCDCNQTSWAQIKTEFERRWGRPAKWGTNVSRPVLRVKWAGRKNLYISGPTEKGVKMRSTKNRCWRCRWCRSVGGGLSLSLDLFFSCWQCRWCRSVAEGVSLSLSTSILPPSPYLYPFLSLPVGLFIPLPMAQMSLHASLLVSLGCAPPACTWLNGNNQKGSDLQAIAANSFRATVNAKLAIIDTADRAHEKIIKRYRKCKSLDDLKKELGMREHEVVYRLRER